jgi:cytoskeletal protein CcmA (bactofilin family)
MWTLRDKSEPSQSDDQNITLLAKDMEFRGTLQFDGTVRIDGRVEGEVYTTGTLIVGETAVLKGIVSVGVLMNSGKINGTVAATEKIHILKPGVLVGDIRTPQIAIEEGGHFHGMCDMGLTQWSEERAISAAS